GRGRSGSCSRRTARCGSADPSPSPAPRGARWRRRSAPSAAVATRPISPSATARTGRSDSGPGRRPTPEAMALSVRPMRAGDAPALAALFEAAVRGAGPQHYTPEQVEAWAAAADTPGFPLATRNVTLVAEDPTGVVGFAALRSDGVDALYVHPDRMREGIGTALLRRLLAEAE